MSRTLAGISAISAMPPALSVIGPYASSATTMPAIESMEVAAIAMPYRPASQNADQMARQMTMTGHPVDFMETAMPAMMLVAWPLVEASATYLTGKKSVPV